ncbi:hypothetical protein HDV00_002411 [Rhizophlyctis rosea]|nr:hypothetical protein HDV00_002411 [Rhizophlyctis rosea]
MDADEEHEPLVPPDPSTLIRSRANRRSKLKSIALLLAAVALLFIVFSYVVLSRYDDRPPELRQWASASRARPISAADYKYGLEKCHPPKYSEPLSGSKRVQNGRFELGRNDTIEPHAVWVRNSTLWDGIADAPKEGWDVLFYKGIIRLVKPNNEMNQSVIDKVLKPGTAIQILDIEGRFVTPGLVDQHR